MSEVIKKIDPKAAALVDSLDDRGRSGSSLLAPLDLEDQLVQVLKWMRGPREIDLPGGRSESVPRFGLISLILQQTPVFVYDHPELKKISKTAFTDGLHIFLSADLCDLLNDNVDLNPSTFGVEWVILHEVMHKLFNHTARLANFPHDIANQATDLSINTKLVEGYPDVPACPKLKETGLGFKPGDRDRWMHLSEEVIAMELMALKGMSKKRKVEDPNQQGQQGQQNQQGQPGQQGQSSQGGQQPGQQGQGGKSGKSQPGGQGGSDQSNHDDPLADLDDGQSQSGGQQPGQPGQGGKSGRPQPGGAADPQADLDDNQSQSGGQPDPSAQDDGPSDVWGDPDDTHFISPGELSKVLEDAGLDAVKDKLELPDSDDAEAIGEMEEAARLKQAEAIMQAQTQMAKVGGQYPGAHIVDAASEMVRDFGKAKVTWRLAVQEVVLGGSAHYGPSMEEPHELAYVDEMVDVLGMRPYMNSMLPHDTNEAVLFLVDTSGSMSHTAMKEAVTEALELKTAAANAGDTAATVFIWPCDTVLRGAPIEITEQNIDEFLDKGVEMKGRGGTDIDKCINQAMTHPLLKDRNIRSIVYCSDLYDNPVPRPSTLEDRLDLKVVFLADAKSSPATIQTFARGTDWADVYVIEEGLEIDFDMVGEQAVNPSIRKKPKMGR